VTRLLLGLWLLAAPAFAAELETGVVDIPMQADNGWQAVADAKGSSAYAAALAGWLQRHPHGELAAQALLEQAALEENLLSAAAILRAARGEAAGTALGSRAALGLARLDYAQDRLESALAVLEDADAWPRPEELEPEWIYWKAQCRLVLKGYARAKADFERLAAAYPAYARREAALLGLAEAQAALKEDDAAAANYLKLYQKDGGEFAAQALWGAATLRQRQGKDAEARQLFKRLQQSYPASFEAGSVPTRLQALAQSPQPSPTAVRTARAGGRYSVQVGAFAKKATADKLVRKLKLRRWPAKVQARPLGNRTLYLVKVGPYKARSAAEAAAKKLEARERLPQRVMED
jgi:cell division septation protein DedD